MKTLKLGRTSGRGALLFAGLVTPALLLAFSASEATAAPLVASDFQVYNPANAANIKPGPFSLYEVPVDSLRPTQLNEGFTEVGKKAAGFDLDSPAGLTPDLLTDVEPVVIGPGGQLYLTDGHHTFTALQDSIYGASNPNVFVDVIANYSSLTTAQFFAMMQSNNLLLPLNDGVVEPVNTATGAPIPTSLTGLTSDPYRGLEYSLLKNKNSKLFTSSSNITGLVGSAIPGLDKMTGYYSDFFEADAYRDANGGKGLPYLSAGDIAYSTDWNLDLLPAAQETTTLPNVPGTVTPIQLPGFILSQNIVNAGGISNTTLSTGAIDGAGGFTGLTQLNGGTAAEPVLIGTPNVGFIMQLGADNGDSVTLNGTNTYTGGTSLLAGHLIVQSDASLGAAAPTTVTINPSSILASVQGANGIIFNSLTEGNATLTLGTTTGGAFSTNRTIAVDGEVATLDANDNTVTLTGQIVSLGGGGVGLGNATGESDLTFDDLSKAATGKFILSTPSPLFYGDIIVGNTGTPTVEVMSDAALGNTTGPAVSIGEVELNGGTLQTGASFSAPERNLFLGGGSQIDVDGFATSWGTITDVQRTLEILNSNTTLGAIAFNNLTISATAILQLAGGPAGETVTFTNGINPTAADTLILEGSTATSLGTTEKVFSGTGLASLVDGIAPAWIVSNDGVAKGAGPYDFVTYTAANGYQLATYNANTTALNAATGAEVVKLSKAVTLTGASSVFALNTNGQTISEGGNTLTIGDGTDPAGLILAKSSAISGGTLAFGNSEGVIWLGGSTATISSLITGADGLTFAGSGAVNLSTAGGVSEGVTGPITIDSGTVTLTSANLFAGDSVLMDNTKTKPAAATLSLTANNELASLVQVGNNAAITLSNGAALTLGDTTNNLSSTIVGNVTETGAATAGALTLNGAGLFDFSGLGKGGLALVSGSSVVVNNSAQFRVVANEFVAGTAIVLNGTSDLQFEQNGGGQFSDTVSGTGTLHLIGGTLQITGTNNTYSGGTIVEIGSTLDITTANLPTANPNITDAGGLILFDQATTGTYSGVISDGKELGSGPMESGELDKDDSTGANAGNLILANAQAYSGETYVEAGQLTLNAVNTVAKSSGVDLGRVGGGSTATLSLGANNTLQALSSELGDTTSVLIGANTLTFNGPSTASAVYGGSLTGTGSLVMVGSGLQAFTGAVSVGSASVTGGVLDVAGGTFAAPATTVSGGQLEVTGGVYTASTTSVSGGTALVAGGALNSTNVNVSGGSLGITSGSLTATTTTVSAGLAKLSGGSLNSANVNVTGGTLGVTGGTLTATTTGVTGGTLQVAGGALNSTNVNVGGGLLDVGAGGGVSATTTNVTGGKLELDAGGSFSSAAVNVSTGASFVAPGGSKALAATSFSNAGLLDIRNGADNNVFTLGAYNGLAGSQLAVGVNITSGTADKLLVATATGTTQIVVTSSSSTALGPYNPNGIPIVVSSGAMASTAFTLAGGPIQSGLFQYDLAYTDPSFVLIGAPNSEAFRLTTLQTAAQSIWFDTANAWTDHENDVREQALSGTGQTSGVWARAVGDWADRSQTQSYSDLNKTYSFQTGYSQNTGGVFGGFDVATSPAGQGDKLIFGAGGGYIYSGQTFKGSLTAANYQGWSVQGTAAYQMGGLFLDAEIKGDFLQLSYNAPSLTLFGAGHDDTTVESYGALVDGGYRFQFGGRAYLEPIASLGYVATRIDGFQLAGDNVSFPADNNLRGRLGASAGATFAENADYAIQGALTGSYWTRLSGGSSATINSGAAAPLLTLNDAQLRNYGEVGISLTDTSRRTGLSAFVDVDYQFGSGFTGGNVNIGARYKF